MDSFLFIQCNNISDAIDNGTDHRDACYELEHANENNIKGSLLRLLNEKVVIIMRDATG